MTVGHLVGRGIETGSDPMGRWVYTKLNASGEKNITVIGIYQPCKHDVKLVGAATATNQQFSMLTSADKHHPHKVRKHFADDLC